MLLYFMRNNKGIRNTIQKYGKQFTNAICQKTVFTSSIVLVELQFVYIFDTDMVKVLSNKFIIKLYKLILVIK
jgi:hypothetical protein